MRTRFSFCLATLLLVPAVLLGACSTGPEPLPAPDYDALRTEWDSLRAERDRLFASESSPLLDSARDAFPGLAYFPYDTTHAYRIRLRPALDRDTILMATSTGEARPIVPYGLLRFEQGGRAYTLTAYEPLGPGPDGRLFIPFQDLTSGGDTYGGGRYLDLPVAPDGVYTLDFNQAYHPYCVYNPAYSCPLPPSENRLSLAVTAGERLPEGYGF